ncbi:MAG: hypothetical protein U0230_26365 [Polyangiales bacterium]
MELARSGSDSSGDGSSVIVVGKDESRVVFEAIAALARHESVYQRGGALVHITSDESDDRRGWRCDPGTPRVRTLPAAVLRMHLTEVGEWWAPKDDHDSDSLRRVHPPQWAIHAIHSAGQWPGIRRLSGIVDAPILRPDGTIHGTSGYDVATGAFYHATCAVPDVAEKPTRQDAKIAADM